MATATTLARNSRVGAIEEEGTMRSLHMVDLAATLSGAQAIGGFACVSLPAAARSDEEVVLVIGDKSQDACEVQ